MDAAVPLLKAIILDRHDLSFSGFKAKVNSITLTKNMRMFTVLFFKDKPGLSELPVKGFNLVCRLSEIIVKSFIFQIYISISLVLYVLITV